jgi:RimJ/RimL family protein N-acetyltransferase
MHVLDLGAASYKGRLLTAGGLHCIARIDFPDTSGDYPFVKVLAASLPPGTIPDWSAVSEDIVRAFRELRPRAVYFHHPSHLALQAPVSRIDTHLVAARARDMATRPEVPGLGRVELRPSASLDLYPRYEAAYAEMLDERPHLHGVIHAESREDLAACMEQGLLLDTFVDGAWAGLVAARHGTIAGVHGLEMVDIVLTRDARGQGLGPAVHQRFARSVAEAEPAAIVMGTISPKNLPSLRAARRAGRLEIGAFPWVDL